MLSINSQVDTSRLVSHDVWVLSLACKPRGQNPEHAMLLVEGIITDEDKKDRYIVYRYDFFRQMTPDATRPEFGYIKNSPGLVNIKEREDEPENAAVVFWDETMADRGQDQGCKAVSWDIDPDLAHTLLKNVQQSKAQPPEYVGSGKQAWAPSMLSSNTGGHNCFTWAVMQLKALNVPEISNDKVLAPTLDDFLVAARTTRHINLRKPEEKQSRQGGCNVL